MLWRPSRSSSDPPTESGISIALVTITIVFFFELFRITHYAFFFFYGCRPFHEGWFDSSDGSWPIFALFSLSFAMLFLLNAVCLTHPAFPADWTDLAIALLNGIALMAAAVVLIAQMTPSTIDFLEEQDSFTWVATREFGGPGECAAAKPYLGRWTLVSRDPRIDTETLPYAWIDLKRDLTYEAARTAWTSDRELGRWWPPGSMEVVLSPVMVFWRGSERWSRWLPAFASADHLVLDLQDDDADSAGSIRLERSK